MAVQNLKCEFKKAAVVHGKSHMLLTKLILPAKKRNKKDGILDSSESSRETQKVLFPLLSVPPVQALPRTI
jgi:hypothetical protein